MLTHEPSLRFWLRYAESEGALVEDAGDQALVVLPEHLCEAAGLPEEATVTSDPDVAREDGAVLLIAGHPALERAASDVLDSGDVARLYLAWPTSAPPATAVLEARAREHFAVDHGRVDATDKPRPAYVPLLRVGALISYAASLSLRFQEQEDAWVDARTGLAVPVGALDALCGRPPLAKPDTSYTALEPDLARALAGAHAQLEQRAAARRAALATMARRALESELARADAYYTGALESIERRRTSAPADRLTLLDAQAASTCSEHARRRREIEEEFHARHSLKPFRLHLLHVAAFILPVEVRRGARRYPFAFTWFAGTGAFADVRCPACSAAEPLVASRERLGCQSCLASRASASAPTADSTAGTEPRGAAKGSPPSSAEPATPKEAPGHRRPATRPDPPFQARSRPPGAERSARRPPPPPRSGRRPQRRAAATTTAARTGSQLALAFWQAVAEGDRWPRRKLAQHSPLSALHRLYGSAAALYAIGVPPGDWPAHVSAGALPSEPGYPEFTTGEVTAAGIAYPYALVWWLEAGKPVVGEVMPSPTPLVLARNRSSATRLQADAPTPGAQLDPVAAAFWQYELPANGLPLTARCLATWWRLDVGRDLDEPPAIAAAVSSAVARAAGLRVSRAHAAASYGTDIDAVDRVTRRLGHELRLDRVRGW